MSYSDAEKQEFRNKDLRISRLAITKSLIEKSEDIYEVEKIIELAEKYVDYIYSKRGQVTNVSDDTKRKTNWEQIALGLNLAIPNGQNVKILNQVIDEYKKAYKASANPKDIVVHILNTFGKYPANIESVKKIVESLKG